MQVESCEPLVTDFETLDMPTTKQQLSAHEARIVALETAVRSRPAPDLPTGAKEGVSTGVWKWVAESLGIPAWGQALVSILVVCFGLIAALGWKFNNQLAAIQGSIRVLETKQPGELQQIINGILSQAKHHVNSGDKEGAQRAALVALTLIEVSKQQKIPADAESFKMAVEDLDDISKKASPDLIPALLQTRLRLALAEYRSSLLPIPGDIDAWKWEPMEHAIRIFPLNSLAGGRVLDFSKVTGSAIVNGGKGLLSENVRVEGPVIKGGKQTLDGIHWLNVTFIGTHISYGGGEVELRNVTFINCTFDSAPGDRGTRFVNYAALNEKQLTLS